MLRNGLDDDKGLVSEKEKEYPIKNLRQNMDSPLNLTEVLENTIAKVNIGRGIKGRKCVQGEQ